jgi:anti-sigma regulatory factor (Ser/Thr protein kinase)
MGADFNSPGSSVVASLASPVLGSVMPCKWPLRDLIEFGALPGAVPCARLHARLVLAEWGLTGLSEQAELVISELMTNAVAASRSLDWVTPVRLWMLSDRAQVMIAVWDANPHLPTQVDADDLAESGRGLRLVDAITAQWDAYATPQIGGKVVRTVIDAKPPEGKTGSP